MRINYIELVGFRRLALNNINSIRITPTQRVQLILGTNGSGKSSLMAELSPLPASANNYTKTGSKEISVSHNGDEYILKSWFSPAQKHSIIKNGEEELNPGGTVTIQKEIVKEVFGVTQEIHDVITGLETFTDMSPTRRREWFTHLSDNDYQYALKVYARVKERLRDTSGALKIAKRRLVAETSKMMNPEAIQGIELQIDDLVREINILYTSRVDESRTVLELEQSQEQKLKELADLSAQFFKLRATLIPGSFLSVEEHEGCRNDAKQEQISVDTEINVLTKEHASLKETFDAFAKSGATGLEDLKNKLEEAQKKRVELLANQRLGLVFNDPVLAQSALESVKDILLSIFSEISENSDRRFSFAKLEELRVEKSKLSTELETSSDKVKELQHRKFHMESIKAGENTECPRCKHVWYPGYDEGMFTRLVKTIETGSDHLTKLRTRLTEVDADIVLQTAYGDQLKEFNRLTRNVSALAPLWSFLLEDGLIFNAPRTVAKHLDAVSFDLFNASKAVECDREIEKIGELVEIAMKASNVDMGKVKTRIDYIEEHLGSLSRRSRELAGSVQRHTELILKMKLFDTLIESIRVAHRMVEVGIMDTVRAIKNETINDCLRALQISLAQKQSSLNDIRMQKGIVDDIQGSINKLEIEEEALKILETSLSPTDGLIAEGLLGFIRVFVRKMNTVVKRVWTYKMEIQDCAVDAENSTELDYRFPVLTQGAEKPVPDVKMGSTGMKDMVNLAFKIITMGHLGHSEYPLLLDEFGSGFDHTHRINATNAIKTILDQLPFSQLWMVSHYEDSYQTFTNAQICVLSESNVVLPSRSQYNQHVVMS